MLACRSHLYVGRSAITKLILEPCHRPHRKRFRYISRNSVGGSFSIWPLCRLCSTDFTQHLLLYPPVGFSKGYCLSYWSIDDVTPLPAEAPPHPGGPTNQGCSRPDTILRMRYAVERITPSFIYLPAFEGKTSPNY